MHRGALHCCACLLALTASRQAFAHGVPPDAYAIISHDAQGARAVSLSAGLAFRRAPQSYQFICPMAWGDQFAAPLAALADGTIVVGATKGLMLLGEDGTLRAHPDPAAVGRSTDVVRGGASVYSLRSTPTGSEVLAIDAQQVRVLWQDTKSLYSLAALDDKLVLLRADGMMLEQVTIAAADGTLLERQTAMLDQPVDNVFARANAGAAYALLVFRNGTVAVGSLRMNAFTTIAQGELSIAGPLTLPGATLLAIDGKLAQLVGDQMAPLTDDHNVVCLAEHDGLAYACDRDGIAHVSGPALAEPLFRFDWLVAPDLAAIPVQDDRFLCNSQWQDLRSDVQLIAPSAGTAGSAAALAGSGGAPLLAAQPTGGVGAPTAGTGPALVVPSPPVQARRTGCATLPGGNTPSAYAYVWSLVFVLAVSRPRRRRSS